MFGQGRQYLVDEKVGDRAGGCVRELVQCIADVTAAGQKRGGQANDGAPPLGEVLDDCEFVVAQRDVVLAEYRGDLGAIESEIGGCKAGESAVESQTMPRERWFVAGGNDNRQVARGLCEYPIEETDRHRIVEGVNVVEDQRCSALVRFEGFRKVREPLLDGRPGSGLHGGASGRPHRRRSRSPRRGIHTVSTRCCRARPTSARPAQHQGRLENIREPNRPEVGSSPPHRPEPRATRQARGLSLWWQWMR